MIRPAETGALQAGDALVIVNVQGDFLPGDGDAAMAQMLGLGARSARVDGPQ